MATQIAVIFLRISWRAPKRAYIMAMRQSRTRTVGESRDDVEQGKTLQRVDDMYFYLHDPAGNQRLEMAVKPR